MGHHAVQEMMEILGYRKVCYHWVPRLLTSNLADNSKERLGTALPSTLQSGFGPLRLPLVRALERSPERSPLRDWRGSQEAVRSWLRGAGTDFYRRGIFKILQRWQKCIDRDVDFVENAWILLKSFVLVCIPSFHCAINVLSIRPS
jgi:hypothetical protein